MNTPEDKPRTSNRALAGKLVLFAAGSFGFGFALVPIYDVLCAVWEVGNRWSGTQASVVADNPQEDRLVTVEFVAWQRAELRFDGLDALVRQMDEDSREARRLLAAPQPVC